MFRRGPWLGQVPLILGPSSWGAGSFPTPMAQRPRSPGDSLREGDVIRANWGRILKRMGFLWFFPDPEVLDKIEALTGRRPSESIEARIKYCNPTPPILPTLGGFSDPDTGYYCEIDLPNEWHCAIGHVWMCSPG
jgi:hypothetical protein